MRPACTGPTGISYTPVPSTVTNGKRAVDCECRCAARRRARMGCQSRGQCAWRTSRRGRGCPIGRMPYRSRHFPLEPAGRERQIRQRGHARDRLRAATHSSSTRRSGRPARNRYTTRSRSPSSWAAINASRKPVVKSSSALSARASSAVSGAATRSGAHRNRSDVARRGGEQVGQRTRGDPQRDRGGDADHAVPPPPSRAP